MGNLEFPPSRPTQFKSNCVDGHSMLGFQLMFNSMALVHYSCYGGYLLYPPRLRDGTVKKRGLWTVIFVVRFFFQTKVKTGKTSENSRIQLNLLHDILPRPRKFVKWKVDTDTACPLYFIHNLDTHGTLQIY